MSPKNTFIPHNSVPSEAEQAHLNTNILTMLLLSFFLAETNFFELCSCHPNRVHAAQNFFQIIFLLTTENFLEKNLLWAGFHLVDTLTSKWIITLILLIIFYISPYFSSGVELTISSLDYAVELLTIILMISINK